MATEGEKTVKIRLNQFLWERLNYSARQSNIAPEKTIERLLDLYLPNLAGNFALAMEKLSPKEREVMEESYYCVMFIVSYADEHTSLKEIRKIEQQLKALKQIFGSQMMKMLALEKERKERLLASIKAMSSEEIKGKLKQLNAVLEKMPRHLTNEYKTHLIDSCIAVAAATTESWFSGESISQVERTMIQIIVQILELPLTGKHAKVLVQPDFQSIQKNKLF